MTHPVALRANVTHFLNVLGPTNHELMCKKSLKRETDSLILISSLQLYRTLLSLPGLLASRLNYGSQFSLFLLDTFQKGFLLLLSFLEGCCGKIERYTLYKRPKAMKKSLHFVKRPFDGQAADADVQA